MEINEERPMAMFVLRDMSIRTGTFFFLHAVEEEEEETSRGLLVLFQWFTYVNQ